MNTKTLALLLLVGHLVVVIVILLVLYRQVRILRQRPSSELRWGRVVLFTLAAAILVGNFIPILIDVEVIIGNIARNRPTMAGVAYALSNVLTLVISAGSLLGLYIIAERLLKKDSNGNKN